jgi:hypothetical protein
LPKANSTSPPKAESIGSSAIQGKAFRLSPAALRAQSGIRAGFWRLHRRRRALVPAASRGKPSGFPPPPFGRHPASMPIFSNDSGARPSRVDNAWRCAALRTARQ